jgi:SP family arabinose:H+ symporter-like MFS transporter
VCIDDPGLSVGLSAVLVPSFVNDSVDKSVSGSIGTIFQINICAWILLAQIVNYVCHPGASKTDVHVDEWNWRLQLALSAVPGLMMLVLSFIMHESPVYLQTLADKERLLDGGSGGLSPVASAGLSDDTEFQNSAKLNNDGGVVAAADEKPKVLGMRDLFTRENIKYVAIALILSSSQQLTGINGIIFYAPGIFKSADMANPLVLTFAVVGTWNLLSVFISFALVDRLGRRVLMLSALAVMAIGAGLMSLAYQAFDAHKGPIAIVALLLFVGAFECGPGPLFFVMAVESYPAHLRDAALSLTQSSVWVFSIIITFGFPVLDSGLGTAATFLIFFITSVLSFILTWWRVPEPHSHSHGHCDTDNAPVKSSSDRAALSDGASGYGTAAYQQL